MKLLITYLPVLVYFFIGVVSVYFIIPKIIAYATEKSWVDKPDWRSSHDTPTPSMGGLSFLPMVALFAFYSQDVNVLLIVAAMLILGSVGYVDDKLDLSSKLKFLVQIIAASMLFFADLGITDFHGIFGIHELTTTQSYVVTVVIVVAIINAFNLIDGIDGLAAGLAFINTVVFGIIFLSMGELAFAVMAFGMAGVLFGFLWYNSAPASIFMGDTGSLVIGGFMSTFFLKVFSTTGTTELSASLAMMLLPAIDMTRLFVVRMLQKKSPFKADKNHYHHMLIKFDNNHAKATITCYAINLIVIVLAFVLSLQLRVNATFLIALSLIVLIYAFAEMKHFMHIGKRMLNMRDELSSETSENQLLNQIK